MATNPEHPFSLWSLPGILPATSWPPHKPLAPCLHAFQSGPVRVHALLLPGDPEPWIARLDPHASEGRRLRARRYHRRADALRCLGAEALLRHALLETHGLASWAIALRTGLHGKPRLAGHPLIQFNLSHAGPWILCVLHDHPVGVDVEEEDRAMPANSALSREELARYRSLAPGPARDYFFRVWTLKESLMKALGLGLALDPAGLTLDFGADGISARCGETPLERWKLLELPMPRGVKAACCFRSSWREHPSAPAHPPRFS